ncbi:ribulokinase [Schaalia suimastitidis]|uniref:ribulokinase n=1 Tax=Schaalia suimastitidis TaxID=121163 RepID=UPI000425767F|nr:ribulokinase [Schaalia suimastitidis]
MNTNNLNDIYLLGLDFGTLSVRAAIVRASDGEVLGDAVSEYETPIMDRVFTAGDGRELPPDFALQVPGDYLASLKEVVPAAIAASGVDPKAIRAVGLDGTSSTVILTDAAGKPMCEYPEFANEPQAYLKLWKHHGAQSQVERIIALAQQRGEEWLPRYGGTLSSEMLLPKSLEVLENAPQLYHATAEIVDLVDWMTWRLTGVCAYAAGDSGYKRMYQDGTYPSRDFLEALHPDFGGVFDDKMSHPIVPLGHKVGGVSEEWAQLFGVDAGIVVAAGNIDAHVHAASVDAVRPGQLTGILGTSSCWILPSAEFHEVPGCFGVVDGGVVEGSWGYESGQSAVGDIFAWFVNTCVPPEYHEQARQRGISVHALLAEKAAAQDIGEHGLVALDWWNGNRSILVDANLSGLIIGQTLTTTPEDQYRALMESTAFGARIIIDNYEAHGVPVDEIRVAGGLLKNRFLMQMYADVTRRPLRCATIEQAGAHGSAIFAAVAAGIHPDVPTACQVMARVTEESYVPREDASKRYDELFTHYRHLYHLFGRADQTMHELKKIRARVREARQGDTN